MLEHLLVSEIFGMLLVFCRIGSAMMVMPGFGEAYVPARARLIMALGVSLIVAAALHQQLPGTPGTPFGLLSTIIPEIVTGIFFGALCRFLVSTLHIAGQIFSFQSSLSTAAMLDFNQAGQGTALGNLLGVVGVTLMFVTNLHHVMLRGIMESYAMFPIGGNIILSDMLTQLTQTLADAFAVAVRLSGPVIVLGLMVNLVGGVVARLMPNFQVFFVIMSPQILLSFIVLMLTFSAIMMGYIQHLDQSLNELMPQ